MSSRTDRPDITPWTLAISATLLAAAALRFLGLQSGLWYDEIVTLVQSARLPLARIVTHFGLNVHPLHSILAHVSIGIFGESAWALRLPACLFGIGTILMVYVLGTRLVSRAEAWAGATVLAVSYHHVWFSQNARGYTMLGFFALLTTDLLLRAIDSDRPGLYLAYALASVAGLYTHLTMGFVIAAHAVVALGGTMIGWPPASKLPIRTLIRTWTIVGLLAVAVYAPFVPDLSGLRQESAGSMEVATTGWAVSEAIRSLLSGEGVAAALIGGLIAVVGGLSLLRRRPLALALLAMPGVLTVVGVIALAMPARPRFVFFLSGAAAICLGRGIGVVAALFQRGAVRPGREPAAAIVGIALALSAMSALALPYNYRLPKQDFDGAVRFLDAAESQGASVVTMPPACLPIAEYYGKTWPCWTSAGDWAAPSDGGRLLVAYTLPEYLENPLRAHVANDCVIVRRFPGTVGGGDIVVCEVHGSVASLGVTR